MLTSVESKELLIVQIIHIYLFARVCARLFINRYVFLIQKLAKSLSVSYGIESDEEGSAGLRLTARGSVTTYTQRIDTDSRTHLNSVGWKRFLIGKNLRVGQAILITIRNTHRPGLRMMIVIYIIQQTYVRGCLTIYTQQKCYICVAVRLPNTAYHICYIHVRMHVDYI